MPKRMLQGVVVSDKQAKTVVVRVDRRFTHPIYKKTIRRSKNYHAHDENNQFKPGDTVWIEESKPVDRGEQADLEIEALDRGPGRTAENGLRPARLRRVKAFGKFLGATLRIRKRTRCINDSDADQPRRGR
jgi:small subunit ribosomal protein S17